MKAGLCRLPHMRPEESTALVEICLTSALAYPPNEPYFLPKISTKKRLPRDLENEVRITHYALRKEHNMKNPFQYGNIVGEDSFCNRKKEIAELKRVIENSGRAFVYSERRFGKTSLVKLVLAALPQNRHITVYVDLWPTDGEQSFVTVLAKAVTESTSKTMEKAIEAAKKLFSHLAPSMTVNDQGKPVVTFGIGKSSKLDAELSEVLQAADKISESGKKKVVIVFDEFQQILEYQSDLVERELRSIIQGQKNVSYIFLGSRKHVVQKMFLDKSRPLYRAATHFPLGPIKEEDWSPFIRERFTIARKSISDEQIRKVCRSTEGHPFYTQHLCHALWELCEPNRAVNDELITQAINTLLARENHAYTILWESLTKNQQRFLKGLASESSAAKPFSSEFISKYQLGTPSSTQRAVQTLLERDIIDHENGSFVVLDRFFRLWIQSVQIGS